VNCEVQYACAENSEETPVFIFGKEESLFYPEDGGGK
jgi:hypothetical protein